MRTGDRVLLGLGVLMCCSLPWLRLNLSPSIRVGFYRLHAVPQTLTYGQLVLVPVPGSLQPWHASGIPLLKPVAGVPGDTACMSDRLTINGQEYGPVYPEAGGMPLPQLRTCMLIAPGFVFLATTHPRSLDSRYMGPVPVSSLRAVATPLLTW